MPYERRKSREQWEQELVARQQNVTPAEYPAGLHYATIPGSPKIVSLGKFVLGIVFMVLGVRVFPSGILASAVLPVLTIAVGLYFVITAIRWKDELNRR